MVVENAFGRLKGRWRCLLKRMDYYETDHAVNAIASCIILHNICESQGDPCDTLWIHNDPSPHVTETTSITSVTDNNAKIIRDTLKEFLYQGRT